MPFPPCCHVLGGMDIIQGVGFTDFRRKRITALMHTQENK
jgi:hypothetical protein